MEKKQKFIFSVIMAIYNVEKYLEEAILSVVNQTLSFNENIQLILVNDGSPDNSDIICKKYKKLYPNNVIYIDKKNGGVSSARNAGLNVATGKYINFLDSDDYFSENTFMEVLKFFEKYGDKSDVVAINLINFENSQGSWVNGKYFLKTQLIDMNKESDFMQTQVGASFIRGTIAKKYRFDESIKIHEDSHYLYRIFCEKPYCGTISNATYWHRIRANGTSATQTIKHKNNIFMLTTKLFRELIDYYMDKQGKVSNFLQTFIILEFNYYVMNKIKDCEFTKKEIIELKDAVKYILDHVDCNSISDHFVLNAIDKQRMLEVKNNIDTLFATKKIMVEMINNLRRSKTYYFLKMVKSLLGKIKRKTISLFKKTAKLFKDVILWVPRKIVYAILKNTLHRIELLQQRSNQLSNDLDLIDEKLNQNNNYLEKNKEELKEDFVVEFDTINLDFENKINELKEDLTLITKNDDVFNDKLKQLDLQLESLSGLQNDYRTKSEQIALLYDKINSELLEIKKELNFYDNLNIKYCMYFHAGSRNHGCEALIKTISTLLDSNRENILLHSFRKQDDLTFNVNKYIKYIVEPFSNYYLKKINYMGNTFFNDDMGVPQIKSLLNKDTIALSIGGDNYCYGEDVEQMLANYNHEFKELGLKTALIGCSIEPELLKKQHILDDLNRYDLITARETITYNSLIEAGIKKNTHLVPDSAFLLNKIELPLPDNFIKNQTVGLNISPLVLNSKDNMVLANYIKLIEYIIEKTTYNIALIPHVLWDKSNDMEILVKLYNMFWSTNRVCLIEEHSAEELKGYIARCNMFIGARTHATIDAYSCHVPTLVIGYSVKSIGIAVDLFGTHENYVIQYDSIKNEDDLIKSFIWLDNNKNNIKAYLEKKMPDYIKPINKLSEYLENIKKKVVNELPYKDNCTGCGACFNICPTKCITMVRDEEGFKYPKVDYSKCTQCNLCKINCPINKEAKTNYHQNIYSAKNIDNKIRINSSSGGVFNALANNVLEKDGFVVGAAFAENMQLEHQIISKVDDLHKLQGSKYLQSDINKVYTTIMQKLNQNHLVLFSGVPCQIRGLKSFLRKEYDNLICVDVICHGVPSPLVFEKYINYFEQENNGSIINFEFRNKKNGWKNYNINVTMDDQQTLFMPYHQNIFMRGFLSNLYLRPSCHHCSANNFRSGSDITLGDFWGINQIDPSFDDDLGVSLVMINTNKGKSMFESISKQFIYKKMSMNDAIKNNPSIIKSWPAHRNRNLFFSKINEIDISENIEKHL